jgi:sugar lactone lactonase YvrE
MSDAIRAFDAPVCTQGEGSVWDAALGALHSVDAADRRMHRNDASGAPTGRSALPRLPGSYAHRACGGILMAWRNGLGLIDPEAGRFEDVPNLPIDFARERINDGACDRRGCLSAGTMDRGLSEPVGALYRILRHLDALRPVGGGAGGGAARRAHLRAGARRRRPAGAALRGVSRQEPPRRADWARVISSVRAS